MDRRSSDGFLVALINVIRYVRRMRLLTLLASFWLGFLAPCPGRLGESVEQIKDRYGKPLGGQKVEYPATVAGLYEMNGFRIVVGFRENKSYYEKFYKLDPKKPGFPTDISREEREKILEGNCNGSGWAVAVTNVNDFFTVNEESHYRRRDDNAKGFYDTKSKVLSIRLTEIEKFDEQQKAEQKKRDVEKVSSF